MPARAYRRNSAFAVRDHGIDSSPHMIRVSLSLGTKDVLHLSHDGWSLRHRTHAGLVIGLHRSKFWTILHHPSYLCQCSLMDFLDHACLFRGIMLPHNAQGLG